MENILAKLSLLLLSLAVVGCGQEERKYPPSLSVENRAAMNIYKTYVKIDDRVIEFGYVGKTFLANKGFIMYNLSRLSAVELKVAEMTDEDAAADVTTASDIVSPVQVYEIKDLTLPEKAVLSHVNEIRFVYLGDKTAKMLLLDVNKATLIETKMTLRELIAP